MIPDLCTWIYDYAMSWLPSWESVGLGAIGLPGEEPESADEPTTAPGTAEALARARDALRDIERQGPRSTPSTARPLDARFRSPLAVGPSLGRIGVDRLVLRLNELDVADLGSSDREALLGAAARLVQRLQQ